MRRIRNNIICTRPTSVEPIVFYHSAHSPWPGSTAELVESEHFVISAFRRWIAGLKSNSEHHWTIVWNDFSKRFGAKEGQLALSGLAGLIRELHVNTRRTIYPHPPCCGCIGVDELGFINFVGACQRANWTLARSQAEWLVKPDGIGGLLESGVRLATVMSNHGLVVPERDSGTLH